MSAPWEEYAKVPSLSNSGMKDLAVSPLRYWYKWVNPERVPEEPTPEMQFGSAVHCALLEPAEFDKRYACELIPPEGCLLTIEDCRAFIRDNGGTPKGTRKADVVAQARAMDPHVPIMDVLLDEHAALHAGKVIFGAEDWQRIAGAVKALKDEPHVARILEHAQTEVCIYGHDKDNDVPLKARLDAVTPDYTLDIKTFRQQRSKSIDESVNAAIWYERYYRQAYFYSALRKAHDGTDVPFILAFVESDPPHETRLRVLRSKFGPNANVYWLTAANEVKQLISTYAECVMEFGMERPWRYAAELVTLDDEAMPQLAYA